MTAITFAGNLAEDPELRITHNGTPVANFVVLENRRVRNAAGEWEKAEPNRHRVKVWRQQAENVTKTLAKGSNVIVTGRLETEKYEKDGATRYSTVVVAEHVGVSLEFQTATIAKAGSRPADEAPEAGDPWPSTDPFADGSL